MSTSLPEPVRRIDPLSFEVPWAAWQRLQLRLGQERRNDEVWDAALQYGVSLPTLSALVEHWHEQLTWTRLQSVLDELPWYRCRGEGGELCFIHRRCSDAAAPPLLLLHGSFGSPLEFRALLAELAESFHVVCPALPGFGLSAANHPPQLTSVAKQLAALMATLGYTRYAVHGSELGGQVAAQLARTAPDRVTRLHVVELRALPEPTEEELAGLSCEERSRLAALTWLEQGAEHAAPSALCELLASALARLDDAADSLPKFRDELLLGLSFRWLGADSEFVTALSAAARAPRWSRSEIPTCVCTFPLAAPSLRRVAERHQRIDVWLEHEHGGSMPALEQPALLLRSIREFCPSP